MYKEKNGRKLKRALAAGLCIVTMLSAGLSASAQGSVILSTANTRLELEEGDGYRTATSSKIEYESEEDSAGRNIDLIETPASEADIVVSESDVAEDSISDHGIATSSTATSSQTKKTAAVATPSVATPSEPERGSSAWLRRLQARIDALPTITELKAQENYALLINTYWEVQELMEMITEETGTMALVFDLDEGSYDGLEDIDAIKLYELADYVEAQYMALEDTGYGQAVASGTSGNLVWTVYAPEGSDPSDAGTERTLVVTFKEGITTGTMTNYTNSSSVPWYDYREQIVNIVLPEGLTRIGWYAFYECTNLREIQLPEGLTYIGAHAFYECTSLTELMLPETLTEIDNDAFAYCTSLGEVEIPDAVKTIGNSAFSYCSIERLILPGSAEVTYTAFRNTDIKELEFKEGNADRSGSIVSYAFRDGHIYTSTLTFPSTVKSIGDHAFLNQTDLCTVDLGSVRTVGSNAFTGCSKLQNLTIPETITSIGSKAFSSAVRLETLDYSAESDSTTFLAADAFSSPLVESLTIGNTTRTLTGNLLSQLQVQELYFEPNNTSITLSDMSSLGRPFSNMTEGEEYYVDSQGVFYTKDMTTLVYCPPGVPDGTVTVLGTTEIIAANAFCRASDLTTVIFEDAGKIKELEGMAFYDCKSLTGITDKSSNTTATTVDEARKLFSGAKIGYRAFANTGLTGTSIAGDFTTDELVVTSDDNVATLRLSFSTANSTTKILSDPARFHDLTGRVIQMNVAADGIGSGSYIYRIYLEPSGDNWSLGDNIDLSELPGEYIFGQGSDLFTVTLKESSQKGVYYMEFAPDQGGTVSFDLTPLYPSPSSAGGTLTIWGAILGRDETDDGSMDTAEGHTCQMAEWATDRNVYGLDKTAGEAISSLILVGEGDSSNQAHLAVSGAVDTPITYKITLPGAKMGEGNGKNAGSDYVKSVEYTDILTLPEGMEWKEGILKAVKDERVRIEDNYASENNIRLDNKAISVELNGEWVELMNLTRSSSSTTYIVIGDCELDVTDDDRLALSWKYWNRNPESEILTPTWTLKLWGDKLTVDLSTNGYNTESEQTLTNEVSCIWEYTYSGFRSGEATCSLPIAVPTPDLKLTKERVGLNNKMGEAVPYVISVGNEGALPWGGSLGTLSDPVSVHQYIKAEDIWRMLEEANGCKLTLKISPATLFDKIDFGTVTTVDGQSTMQLTPANSNQGEKVTENALLVLEGQQGEAVLNAYEGTESGKLYGSRSNITSAKDLQEAFDEVGYVVTKDVRYTVSWDLGTLGSSLYGGQYINFPVYCTLKNTFQSLGGNLRYDITSDSSTGRRANTSNTVTWTYGPEEEEKTISASCEAYNIYRDYRIHKSYSRLSSAGGGSGDDLGMGDILEYKAEVKNESDASADLPLVDILKGAHLFLAPVEANRAQAWAGGEELETVTYDGTEYYILTSAGGEDGTYKGVWMGEATSSTYAGIEGLLYADSVTVQDGVSIVNWHFKDLGKGTFTVAYLAIVKLHSDSTDTGGYRIYLDNTVYLNGRYGGQSFDAGQTTGGDAIYDTTGIYALVINADKKIITSPVDAAHEETATHSAVSEGQEVRYRCSLFVTNTLVPYLNIDARDILPETFDAFEWSTENVEISYKDRFTQEFPTYETPAWEIVTEEQKTGTRYIIQWKSAFTVPGNVKNGGLDIYVTLKFPKGDVWDTYMAKSGGNAGLTNTFDAGFVKASVTHELAEKGRAYLQKGVFRVGETYYYRNYEYMTFPTREYYSNSVEGTGRSVIYYLQIYNGGSGRLYLTDVQDLLPKGFTLSKGSYGRLIKDAFMSRASEDSMVVNYYNFQTTQAGYYEVTGDQYRGIAVVSDESRPADTITAKQVTVTVEAKPDGEQQRLIFSFGKEGTDDAYAVGYDEELGLCYLKKGESICFGYVCDVGEEAETEDYALNTAAMPYLDYAGLGVETDESITGRANDRALAEAVSSAQNTGECSVLTNEKAAEKNFYTDDTALEDADWLYSGVTVERGGVVPGIKKETKTYTPSGSTTDQDYVNGIGNGDKVNWLVTLSNDGTKPIDDYIIRDTMEAPFEFVGTVSLTVYAQGMSRTQWAGYRSQLFELTREKDSKQVGIKGYRGWGSSGAYEDEITIYDSLDEAEAAEGNGWTDFTAYGYYMGVEFFKDKVNFKLRLYKTSYGETMELWLSDYAAAIHPEGYAELAVSTQNTSSNLTYSVYHNQAMLIPIPAGEYDESRIVWGENVQEDGENVGVRASSTVNVTGGYGTGSVKRVEELDEDGTVNGNWTDSRQTNDKQSRPYITLKDGNSEFLYTLEVTNNNQNDLSMGNLVVIDNLPEVDDHTTLTASEARESQFKVSFADDPEVTVKVISEDRSETTLDEGTYTVMYSADKLFGTVGSEGGWTKGSDWKPSADWSGSAGSPAANWSESLTPKDARSLRVEINSTDAENPLIPADAVVHIIFKARVDKVAANSMDGVTDLEKANLAEPGEIAWNSFAYQYNIQGFGMRLESAPLKVGVRIPDVPVLEKQLLGVDGEAMAAKTDQTFRFLIHEGGKLDGVDYNASEAELTAAVEAQTRNYVVVELTVPKDESSANLKLDPSQLTALSEAGWKWEDGDYTIAELSSDNADYLLSRLLRGTENGAVFTYSSGTSITLRAENRIPDWTLMVKKIDSKVQTTVLPGAVFGLYGAVEADMLTAEELDVLSKKYQDLIAGLAGQKDQDGQGRFNNEGTIYTDGEGKLWYLTDIQETNENGVLSFTLLTGDIYRLRELEAPEGYLADGVWKTVEKPKDGGFTQTKTVDVENVMRYELPKTGGTGTFGLQVGGWLLILSMAELIYKKRKKQGGR